MKKDFAGKSPPLLKGKGHFNIPGFPLAIYRHKEHKHSGLHAHQFTELVVITGGSGIHFTDNGDYPVSRGDVFIINGRQAHGYRNGRNLALVNILFDMSKLGISLKDLENVAGYNVLFRLEPAWRSRRGFRSRLRLSAGNLAEVEVMIAELETELQKKLPGYQCVAAALLTRLIGYLSRCYSQFQAENCHAFIRIAAATEHLEAHYDQRITLAQLADMVHLSVRHFQRAFRKGMGISPIDHLVRLRIARAAEFLQKEPDLNITEIAFKAGFQDSNYFARQFRRIMGRSPREYRQRNAE